MPSNVIAHLHRLPIALLAALTAMTGIFIMSARHTVPVPPGFSAQVISVLGHFSVYFVLAGLLYWTLTFILAPGPGRYATAWGLAVLYGLSDEWHQSFVPGRTPDIVDILTDAAGAVVSLLFVWWITQRVGRPNMNHQGSRSVSSDF